MPISNYLLKTYSCLLPHFETENLTLPLPKPKHPCNTNHTEEPSFKQYPTMIIDAKTIIITLAIVCVAGYFGLQLIRSFALSIAQENHDANLAADMSVEAKRARREQEADAAAMAAFAKVEPLLPSSVVNKGMSLKAKPAVTVQAPSSGGLQTPLMNEKKPAAVETLSDKGDANLTAVVDEEAQLDQPATSEVIAETPVDQMSAVEEIDEDAPTDQLTAAADNEER